MDRLATLDPGLVDAIEALPDDATRRQRAFAAAEAVAQRRGIRADPAVAAVLTGPDAAPDDAAVGRLSDLVEILDERAWDLQDEGEDEAYKEAFAVARAANAVLEFAQGGADGNLGDVIYEAHAAVGDLGFVRPFVVD